MASAQLETAIKFQKTLNGFLDTGISVMKEIGESFGEQGDQRHDEELKEYVVKMLEMQSKVTHHLVALSELKDHALKNVSPELELSNEESLSYIFESNLAKQGAKKKKDVTKHPRYKAFVEALWVASHYGEPFPGEDIDEDLVISTQKVDADYLCPLTRAYFESPHINSTCKHHFSQKAIFDYIRQNQRGRQRVCPCPVMGCNAQVSEKTLAPDIEFGREMAKFIRSKKRKRDEDNSVINI